MSCSRGNDGMSFTRPKSIILDGLSNQRAAIASSCRSFDEGNIWEAGRLAAAVYIVVHDASKRDASLLTRLGIRGKVRFLCSNPKSNPRNLLPEYLLLGIEIRDTCAKLFPALGSTPNHHRFVQFHEWWERDIIIRIGSTSLSRKRIVFNMRNKEGGAHFDTQINDPAYIELLTKPVGMFSNGRGIEKYIFGAEIVTMRQIAWELEQTLANLEVRVGDE